MNDAIQTPAVSRRLLVAETLSVGSELTVGETRDTNSGELARDLSERGVRVGRLTAVPDDLGVVRGAFEAALGRADLVVSTGGLGPTPDDLTRESIAALVGETPVVDPAVERWLRERFARRNTPFAEANLKQAWLIPSAEALSNPNGTAPGWFVRVPTGGVIVALPGPPREMRPMWRDEALPRLAVIGLGTDVRSRTFRLHGIGESSLVDVLGESLLRTPDPVVATYARVEAVDVRVSSSGPGAAERVAAAAALVEQRVGRYVWATGETTWAQAIEAALVARGWSLSIVEIGTRGAVGALFGGTPPVTRTESRAAGDGEVPGLAELAAEARSAGAADVGLAVAIRPDGEDTAVTLAIVSPAGTHEARRLAFLGGALGASRAAIATAAVLLEVLRGSGSGA
jgi:nicotinamide-nucleotide amidase